MQLTNFTTTWFIRISYLIIVVIPLAMPLNAVLGNGPFATWKQALLIVSSVLGVVLISNARDREEFRLMRALLVTWALCATLSLMVGILPVRVFYSYFYYVGTVAFIILPLVVCRAGQFKGLFWVICSVTTICGAGLVLDYQTNVFQTLQAFTAVGKYADYADLRSEGFRRAAFLFETSSNCFPLLSLGMALCVWYTTITASLVGRIFAASAASVSSVGIILTQTRTQWFGLAAFWILTVLFLAPIRSARATVIPLFIIASMVVGVIIYNIVSSSDQLDDILTRMELVVSDADASNETRYEKWRDGFALFKTPSNWFPGSGVGAAAGQVGGDAAVISNFESSFLLAFGEGGILGLILRYLPALFIMRNLVFRGGARTILGRVLLVWTVCWLVVTATAPTAGSYHGLYSLCIVAGLTGILGNIEVAVLPNLHRHSLSRKKLESNAKSRSM
jgi:hypothetical protein